MALFLSTYINKVDAKGRVSLPADFRTALGGDAAVILFPSFKTTAIEGWSQDRMARLADEMDKLDAFSDQSDNLTAAVFARAKTIPVDSNDGRIILPPEFRAHAGIKAEAKFVGLGRTFQIWQPDAHESHAAEAAAKASGQGVRLSHGGAS